MQAELQSTNTTVRGAFNRAIISPRWLVKHAGFSDGEAEHSLKLHSDEQFFKFGDYAFTVGSNHLRVAPIDSHGASDPGMLVSRILGILEHTPITALGHNFTFVLDGISSSMRPMLGGRSADEVCKVLGGKSSLTSGWSLTFESADLGRVAVVIGVRDKATEVSLNYHVDTNDIGEACSHSKIWAAAKRDATRCVSALFGEAEP